jgi:hypothetical protein
MPRRFRRRLLVVLLGVGRGGPLLAAALWGTPGWSGKSAVWDFREARFELDASDIQDIARFILRSQPATPPSRVAFVTARDVDFGMARMFEAYRADPRTEFRVFRSYDDAVHWAGTQEPGPRATG